MERVNVSTQNEMGLYPEQEKQELFVSARGTEVPRQTKQIALRSFPKGNRYLSLRDEYGPLFSTEDFSDLYTWKGGEEIPADILGTVTVLQ